MTAPRYDRGEIAADLAALRAAEGDAALKLHAALVEAMADLPQAARVALVAHDEPRDDKPQVDRLRSEGPSVPADATPPRPDGGGGR